MYLFIIMKVQKQFHEKLHIYLSQAWQRPTLPRLEARSMLVPEGLTAKLSPPATS